MSSYRSREVRAREGDSRGIQREEKGPGTKCEQHTLSAVQKKKTQQNSKECIQGLYHLKKKKKINEN